MYKIQLKEVWLVESLVYMVYIVIIMLVGLLCSFLSKKVNLPRILLLIIAGRLLYYVRYNGQRLMIFSNEFVAVIGVFALAMIVFDAASRFRFREIDTFSHKALRSSVIILIINIITMAVFTKLIFQLSWFLAVIFATLISGTSAGAVAFLKKKTHKVYEMLRIEAMLITPIVVLVPFIFLDIIGIAVLAAHEDISAIIIQQVGPFFLQFIIGIGAGLMVGLFMTKFFNKRYSNIVSPIALMTSILVAYVLAELLNGNGVLSVCIYGLFYGNIFIKQKMELREFSGTFAVFLEIIVFILLGLVLPMPSDVLFVLKAILIFSVYTCIRFIILNLSFKKHEFTLREKIFMALHTQKGIAVAAVTLALISYALAHSALLSSTRIASIQFLDISGSDQVLGLLFLSILFSVILSIIAIKCSDYFLKVHNSD